MTHFECALHAGTEIARYLVDRIFWMLKQLLASSAVPFLLGLSCHVVVSELASVARLMHSNLAEPTNNNLILIIIIQVLANIASYLVLFRILLYADVLS